MPHVRAGHTLVEIVIVVTIVSIIALAAASSYQYITVHQVNTRATADMQDDVNRIFHELELTLGKAGDGVSNSMGAVFGASIMHQYETDVYPKILFFYKDKNSSGQMDSQDEWLRYSVQDNKLKREKFLAALSTDIEQASPPAPVETKLLSLSDGVRFSSLSFGFYGAQGSAETPPVPSNAASASYVKVHLELERSGKSLKKDDWIYLANLVHARQNP